MKQRIMKLNFLVVLLAVCVLLVGCDAKSSDTLDFSEFEISYIRNDDRADRPWNYMDMLESLTDGIRYGWGMLGTIAVKDYHFYMSFEYDERMDNWYMKGHVEFVCDITDISDTFNNSDHQIGDQVILHELIVLKYVGEDIEKHRAFLNKIGDYLDPETGLPAELTEEERKLLEQDKKVIREYPVPIELINADEFELRIYNDIGMLMPGAIYDVMLLSGNNIYYAYSAEAKESGFMEYFHEDDRYVEACTTGFGAYLAEHRAELGLADVAVKE